MDVPWAGIAYRYGVTVSVSPWDATATDGGGNPVPAYGTPFEIKYCVLDLGASYEPPLSGFSRVNTTPTLYLLPGAPAISEKDRIDVPGNGTFEVDGFPRVWPVGVAVSLRRVDG